ncbi:MAG: HPr family phosphocarrier protein [Desulfobacteraceae bacterium]|nr:MAG: HPr family phosphocarrier protein [Desulfobacteraceae bacterium]
MKASLTEIIPENEFLELAQDHSRNFLRIYSFLQNERRTHTRKFYSHLIVESEEFESFLDDHCARDNKTWHFFCELVACIRNLAKAAFILGHILKRYHAYDFREHESNHFLEDAEEVSIFLDDTIFSLFLKVEKEALRLGMTPPDGTLYEESFGEYYPQKRLPYNIDEEDESDAKRVLAKIASQYLGVISKVEHFGWNMGKSHSDHLVRIVPGKVDEEKSREVNALIHNLQSTYDHYIRRTPLELQDEDLGRFRSFVSMPMHLMSIVNWLSHLYERHILTARREKNGEGIPFIIDGSRLLDVLVNFALFHANRYLQTGRNLACEFLGKYTEIDTCELKVPEKLGFHLRPASLIVKLAKHYGTKLSLIVDGKEYDASNVLSITMAAGLIARKGYRTVIFEGDKRCLADLKILSQCNYGEDEKGNATAPPRELSHLWT